jgi:hypothetical protein
MLNYLFRTPNSRAYIDLYSRLMAELFPKQVFSAQKKGAGIMVMWKVGGSIPKYFQFKLLQRDR